MCYRPDSEALPSNEPLSQDEFEATKRKVEEYAYKQDVQSSLDIPYIARFLGPAFSIFKSLLQKAFKERDSEREVRQSDVSQNTISHLSAQARFPYHYLFVSSTPGSHGDLLHRPQSFK